MFNISVSLFCIIFKNHLCFISKSKSAVKKTSFFIGFLFFLLFSFSNTNAQTVQVTSPNGGKNWYKGYTYEITWDDDISENVKIELWNEAYFDATITESTESDGSFMWQVPEDTNPSDWYRIKVQSVDDPFIKDLSDEDFEIFEFPSVTVNSPNGGEVWRLENTYTITWTDNLADNVNIFLYKGGTWSEGGTKTVIATNLPSDGSYTWTIAGGIEAGNDYKIQVKGVNNIEDESFMDYSDNYFTITDTIRVITPNGGENWDFEKEYNIEWTDDIDDNVRIELWRGGTEADGGEMMEIIKTSTASNGFFRWGDAVDLEEDDDYKIRIKNIPGNDFFEDYSDDYFRITNNTPEGGLVISLPHDVEHKILPEDDVDWYTFTLYENTTYRFYNTSSINLDTKLTLYGGQWEEYFYVILYGIVAEDDNSGGNQQPFFDYTPEFPVEPVWLKVAVSDDVNESNETTGDYTLRVFELSNKLNSKMFLEGAYNQTTDMINTELGTNIPKTSPYSVVDEQTVDEIPEGVVDWVLVELRDKDNNLLVVSSRSAFLLNTGMIVDTDGVSDVQFNAPKDSYYIVVKHRNHLPVMSSELVEF